MTACSVFIIARNVSEKESEVSFDQFSVGQTVQLCCVAQSTHVCLREGVRPFILHVRPIDMSVSCTVLRKLEVFICALIPFASRRKNFMSFVSSQVRYLVSDILHYFNACTV